VLELRDEPVGDPGPGEVLLEVRAAAVNPIDWKLYSGMFGTDASKLPMRLGFEAAGVVLATGPEAAGPAGPVAPGDEVIGFHVDGAYAARIVAPAGSCVPRPETLSWAEASGLMLVGATAVHALTVAAVTEGDTVLIHSASGGVGLMAVQLAKLRGARVIGTGGERSHERLLELGAEPVIYGEGLADRVRALAPDGVDAALDLIGNDEAVDVSLELVSDRDRIVSVAAAMRASQDGFKLIGSFPGADPGTEIRDRARLDLAHLAAEGKLRVWAQEFPLAQAADAHRASIEGHALGKIVLVP
jgi:NADPH:quinone reductase-like Zn-dependent oxidoreductase